MLDSMSQSSERRQLLLTDGQFSLAALSRSLAADHPADGEALLHASDLASMFSGLGFKDAAEVLKNLAQGLSEDPLLAMEASRALLPKVRALMDAIQAEDPVVMDAARQAICAPSHWPSPISEPRHGMPVTMLEISEPAIQATPAPSLPPQTMSLGSPATAQPGLAGAWVDPPPFFSAGLSAGPFADLAQAPAARVSLFPDPLDWCDVRLQALENVQDASALAAAQQPDALALQLKLQSVQDGLVRVGQLPLSRVYPDTPGAQDLWVDPSLLELLDHLQVFSQRAQRMALQTRNLTLFATWFGATLSHAELQHVGDKVAQVSGRIDTTDSGIELVLPVSLQRMRMVSFEQEGQWHAHPWAQFAGWSSGPEGLVLQLRIGTQNRAMKVSQQGAMAPMNLYPWPTLVPAPSDLTSIAIDGRGQIHLVDRCFT
jgi:hypothetical protein